MDEEKVSVFVTVSICVAVLVTLMQKETEEVDFILRRIWSDEEGRLLAKGEGY